MAKHELMAADITAAGILENMERRYSFLYSTDRYNGQDAGEFSVLEGILGEIEEERTLEVSSADDFAKLAGEDGVECVVSSGVSRSATVPPPFPSPRLLTGGFPSTASPESPLLPFSEVHEFSHASVDGNTIVGFEGRWTLSRFERLLKILDLAKEEAIESAREDGLEGFPLDLDGYEVLVSPKGGLAGGDEAKGGVVYKYHFFCQGVEFVIHSKPSQHIQPVEEKREESKESRVGKLVVNDKPRRLSEFAKA